MNYDYEMESPESKVDKEILTSILLDNDLEPSQKLDLAMYHGFDLEQTLEMALDLHGITI